MLTVSSSFVKIVYLPVWGVLEDGCGAGGGAGGALDGPLGGCCFIGWSRGVGPGCPLEDDGLDNTQ